MICPHCQVAFNDDDWTTEGPWSNPDIKTGPKTDYELAFTFCPECGRLVIRLNHGQMENRVDVDDPQSILRPKKVFAKDSDELLYPKHTTRPIPSEVPEPYRSDYVEACAVMNTSAKASAALSRRMLQTILQDEFKIKKRTLADEVEEFIQLPGVSMAGLDDLDAIRNIGNFAAHPTKNTNTGEIVEVGPGEAEWLLEILDALLDFTFVQPKRREERKRKLDEKLKSAGKPPMK